MGILIFQLLRTSFGLGGYAIKHTIKTYDLGFRFSITRRRVIYFVLLTLPGSMVIDIYCKTNYFAYLSICICNFISYVLWSINNTIQLCM